MGFQNRPAWGGAAGNGAIPPNGPGYGGPGSSVGTGTETPPSSGYGPASGYGPGGALGGDRPGLGLSNPLPGTARYDMIQATRHRGPGPNYVPPVGVSMPWYMAPGGPGPGGPGGGGATQQAGGQRAQMGGGGMAAGASYSPPGSTYAPSYLMQGGGAGARNPNAPAWGAGGRWGGAPPWSGQGRDFGPPPSPGGGGLGRSNPNFLGPPQRSPDDEIPYNPTAPMTQGWRR